MAHLPVEDVTLDGEAVCLLEDGRPDFHALRSGQFCTTKGFGRGGEGFLRGARVRKVGQSAARELKNPSRYFSFPKVSPTSSSLGVAS